MSAINLAIEAVGQELRAPVADIGKVLGDPTANNLFVDPIHPSAEGHRIAAEVIGKAILQNRGSIEN